MAANSTSFRKGQINNPHGRPKALIDVVALARSKTKENMERISDLAANAKDENVRLRASQLLHEIAWGKPAQAITGPTGGPIAITFSWQSNTS